MASNFSAAQPEFAKDMQKDGRKMQRGAREIQKSAWELQKEAEQLALAREMQKDFARSGKPRGGQNRKKPLACGSSYTTQPPVPSLSEPPARRGMPLYYTQQIPASTTGGIRKNSPIIQANSSCFTAACNAAHSSNAPPGRVANTMSASSALTPAVTQTVASIATPAVRFAATIPTSIAAAPAAATPLMMGGASSTTSAIPAINYNPYCTTHHLLDTPTVLLDSKFAVLEPARPGEPKKERQFLKKNGPGWGPGASVEGTKKAENKPVQGLMSSRWAPR